MRSPALLAAVAGLIVGAGTIALLPGDTLFHVPTAPHTTAGAATPGERWACPMMDFIGNKPGDCPVCGMKMTKVTAGELTREQQRRMDVETVRLVEGPATVTLRAYGAADYDHRFTTVVIPRVRGRIVKRYIGAAACCEDIEAGAPLVDLYSPEVFAAQHELTVALKLGDQPAIDALTARFQRWNLAAVAEAIAKGEPATDTITIHSPRAGQVLLAEFDKASEAIEVGREVAPDTPLVRLVDPNRLVLVVHVPEMRARFLREGQPVELESDDRGAIPQVRGVVGRIAQEINPELRSREVRIFLEGARAVLSPGSLVSARIKGVLGPDLNAANPEQPDSWGRFVLIPKAAVLSTGVRNVAWRVAGRESDGRMRFEIAPLALGPRIEDEHGNDVYIVRAGAAAGEEVATRGVFLIDSQAQLAGTPSLLFPNGAVSTSAPAAPAEGQPHSHQH